MLKRRVFAMVLLFSFMCGQSLWAAPVVLAAAAESSSATLADVSSAEVFVVEDAAIDAMFAAAEEVEFAADIAMLVGTSGQESVQSEKKAAVAFILSWFLGTLGIHRAYMGTSAGVVIGYILTCGGLGIVALIDWIVLLIALVDGGDISKYVGSKKFFMW